MYVCKYIRVWGGGLRIHTGGKTTDALGHGNLVGSIDVIVCMHIKMYANIFIYTYMHIKNIHRYVHACENVFAYENVCMLVYVCMCVCVYVCIQKLMYVCVNMCV